jgi:hypothetical protein
MALLNKEDCSSDETEEARDFFLKLGRLTSQPSLSEEFYDRLRESLKNIRSGTEASAIHKGINPSKLEKMEAVRLLAEFYGLIDIEQFKLYLPGQEAQRIAEQTLDADTEPETSAHTSDTSGVLYIRGRHAFNNGNYTLAVEQFRLAAKKGHSLALKQLLRMYLLGEGVAEDLFEAAIWFRIGCEQGIINLKYFSEWLDDDIDNPWAAH